MTNKHNTVFYTGVTNNLDRRIYEHRNKLVDGFTKKYNINKLIYYEDCGDIKDAIIREKEIKGWRREKKLTLIKSINKYLMDIGD